MKRTILTFLLFGITVILLSCTSLKVDSEFVNDPPLIDGKAEEWKDKLVYFEDENIFAGAVNDDAYLYLCFNTSNVDYIRQILRFGVTVCFDAEDGFDETPGLRYPAVNPRRMRQEPANERHESGFFAPEKLLEMINDRLGMIQVFKGEIPGEMKVLSETEHIEAALDLDKFLLTIEYKVPIGKYQGEVFSTGTEPGKMVRIGFTTPNLKEIFEKKRAEFMSGRSSGGMRTGSKPGGMRGRGMRQMSEIPDNLDFWFDTKILPPRN